MAICRYCKKIFKRNGTPQQKLCDFCWEIARTKRKKTILLKKPIKSVLKSIKYKEIYT